MNTKTYPHSLLTKDARKEAHEVELCYQRPLYDSLIKVKTPEEVNALMRTYLGDQSLDVKEHCWILCLTSCNGLLSISLLSIGSIKGTTLSVREIMQTVLLMNAVVIIVVHNHPSGNLKPSQTDLEMTQRIARAAKIMEITFLDHVIISSEHFYSFREDSYHCNLLESHL